MIFLENRFFYAKFAPLHFFRELG